MNTFSILTYNFVSIPLVTKNLNNRLAWLIKEISNIKPEIICFQELWWSGIRNRIIKELTNLGYHFYFPTPGILFNGLLTCSRMNIHGIKAYNLKPTFSGFNRFLIESLGSKGYSLVKIELSNKERLYVFNVHLSCHWQTDILKKESVYCRVKLNSLETLAKDINAIGKEKIISAGDFNIRPDWWFYQDFIKKAKVKDIVPSNFETILPTLFKFHMPSGGRTDYIFTKNIPRKSVSELKLLWDKPINGIGQLSDHAGILATFKVWQ